MCAFILYYNYYFKYLQCNKLFLQSEVNRAVILKLTLKIHMSCKIFRQDLRIAECLVHLSGHTLRSKSRKGERARHRTTSAMRFVINQIVFFKGAGRNPWVFRARMVMKTVAWYSPITFPATKETRNTRVSLTKTTTTNLTKPIAAEYESHLSYSLIARTLRIPAYVHSQSWKRNSQCLFFNCTGYI